MVYKTTSVKTVIDKVHRDLNLDSETRWVAMIEWCAEALHQIGHGSNIIEKFKTIPVKDHRAELPCDLEELIAVHVAVGLNRNIMDPMVYSQSTTNIKETNESRSYTINGSYINTSFKEGYLGLKYRGIELDDEGYPTVPDEVSFMEALFWYCYMKLMLGTKAVQDSAKTIGLDFVFIQSQWHWYCGQAKGKAMLPSLDKMEAIKRQWLRLIPNIHEHSRGFKNLTQQEFLR